MQNYTSDHNQEGEHIPPLIWEQPAGEHSQLNLLSDHHGLNSVMNNQSIGYGYQMTMDPHSTMNQGDSATNGMYYDPGPMPQQQQQPQQLQQPQCISNPSLALRRPTYDDGQGTITPLDMDNLLGHLPSANSPLGSAPSPSSELVATPTSEYDQWETGSQNGLPGSDMNSYRQHPINLSHLTISSNAHLLDPSHYPGGAVSLSSSPSATVPTSSEAHLTLDPTTSLSRTPSRSRSNSKTNLAQPDHLGPGPVRSPSSNLRRVKSDSASGYGNTCRTRSRARSRAGDQATPPYPTSLSPYGPSSASPSEATFPSSSQTDLSSLDPDEKRRQIEKKSREKRNAALDKLKSTLSELMGMSFQDRNQSEVFESASNLLRHQQLRISELNSKVDSFFQAASMGGMNGMGS